LYGHFEATVFENFVISRLSPKKYAGKSWHQRRFKMKIEVAPERDGRVVITILPEEGRRPRGQAGGEGRGLPPEP
jgi:hypothetical protein